MDLELPRHVHRYGGVSLIVWTQVELEDALASGWFLLPPQTPPEPVEAPIATETAEDVPTEAVPVQRKPGRPRKATE